MKYISLTPHTYTRPSLIGGGFEPGTSRPKLIALASFVDKSRGPLGNAYLGEDPFEYGRAKLKIEKYCYSRHTRVECHVTGSPKESLNGSSQCHMQWEKATWRGTF